MVIQFDASGGVYEVFTSEGEWLACFDTHNEARDYVRKHLAEIIRRSVAEKPSA